MTTPTLTPVPSSAPQDLVYNAEKLDEALNTGALTYTDRFGTSRKTLAGAVASISAVNMRGAWVTATAYAARDVVSNSGTWYIALDNHTSGATFSGDTAAHWRVYQGVIAADLADTSDLAKGAGLVGQSIQVISTMAVLRTIAGSATRRLFMMGYAADNDGGQGTFYWSASASAADDGGTVINPTGNVGNGRWMRVINTPFMPEWFGAKGDNTTDDLAAFNALIAALPAGGEWALYPGRTYRLSAVLTYPTTKARLRLFGRNATIRADHNGHCIDLTAANETYSRHVLEDVDVQGPNVSYPMTALELAGTSTGAGIKIGSSADTSNTPAGYNIELRNVNIRGFKYGRYMRSNMLGLMVGGSISYCQYGDCWDGGQSNANKSIGVRIRENRIMGVTSTGAVGGSLTNATKNVYTAGCVFETNIPYRGDNPAGFSGGYPTAMDTSGTVGVGVYLYNSYDFSFSHNYYENHNYSAVIDGSSDHSTFIDERFDGGGPRIGGVKLMGAGVFATKFLSCHKNSTTNTEVNIESNHVDHATAEFLDCRGFNLVSASLTGVPYVRNMGLSQAGGGMVIADNRTPPQGVASDVQNGTAHGQIEGIGTATATLHCQGFQVFVGNTAISAAGANTTITAIDCGVQRVFEITILNLSATRSIVIKNNSVIKTKSGADVTLAQHGTIRLWIAPSGTAYER